MELWPHQQKGIDETLAAIGRGVKRICVTSPTGGGKTQMMLSLAERYLAENFKVILYTNRRMLIDQTSEKMMEAGVYHGVRAAGYVEELEHPFQISSIQTEDSKVNKRKEWLHHAANLVLVDEARLQTGKVASDLFKHHVGQGAVVVGFDATPLGLFDYYDELVIAGTTSELRQCGALVPCITYAPDEPDLKAFKRLQKGEDLTEGENRKAIMRPGIFGRVWDNFEKINPEHRPTILFAPGVRESLWFAEQFTAKGVRAAHIDGQHVWDGHLQTTSKTAREDILEGSRDGRIGVLCNRYVLREGVDAPWLSHGIFATLFGSLQSYLQSGGRLLRAHPGLEFVSAQDHGGNYWRHGSLNENRTWSLAYDGSIAFGLRADRLRENPNKQPFRCPKCHRVWTFGTRCQPAHGGCGYELGSNKRSRPVVSAAGTLREMSGDYFVKRRIYAGADGPKKWERMYWRSRTKKGAKTFKAAAALFASENFWGWPDPSWPLMPRHMLDWYSLVEIVPMERLTR